MRLEIRSSAGETCPECGSHELLRRADTEAPLVEDIAAIFDKHAAQLEADLLGLHIEAVEKRLTSAHDAYTEEIDRVLGPQAKKLRFLKRRYQERVRSDLKLSLSQLLQQTRFA